MSLSGKTDAEISQLLSEYGVKHGPIVDSTRSLYEKKLIEAMENKAEETPSDKTYYREEGTTCVQKTHPAPEPKQPDSGQVEEVTYVSYPTQVTQEAHGDGLRRRGSFEKVEEKENDYPTQPQIQSTRTVTTTSQSNAAPVEPIKKSGGCMATVLKLLLVVLLALFVYYMYCCMENNKVNPFGVEQS